MEMKLNIYSKERNPETGKKEIIKTYTTEEYDLMWGTVQDILSLFALADINDVNEVLKMATGVSSEINPLLKDVFWGVTDEELRNIKLEEVVPVIVDIIKYSMEKFGLNSKNLKRGQK